MAEIAYSKGSSGFLRNGPDPGVHGMPTWTWGARCGTSPLLYAEATVLKTVKTARKKVSRLSCVRNSLEIRLSPIKTRHSARVFGRHMGLHIANRLIGQVLCSVASLLTCLRRTVTTDMRNDLNLINLDFVSITQVSPTLGSMPCAYKCINP